MTKTTATQTVTPTRQDSLEADELLESLARSLKERGDSQQTIQDIKVSPAFARFLSGLLEQIAAGHTVAIKSLPDELTTTVAADELSVSRMTLMKWIREGVIPSHKVGTHTRLMRDDVAALRARRLAERRDALADLLALEDELDLP